MILLGRSKKEKTMRTNSLGVIAVFALIWGYAPGMAAPPPDMDGVPLTLSGCVVAGEGNDSFLLTNVVVDGTALAPVNAFYRFNSTDGLKRHIGHRVEVKGKADLDDVDKGKVRVRTEDGRVTTEVSSERRSVKAADIWFGTLGAMKLDANVATYKFNVDSVKRLAGNCAHAAAAR